ncbi:MAG: hypothetical protein MSS57_00065 [Bacteroidales bacterium]|nr:hypothetical protein [Bacteroidales bacterium]MCI7466034.1 hypothetical protein [Bacteroidales bacterium]MDY4932328.1 hypothetical protein [Candidatus Onthomorpha sp.]
MTLSYAVGGPHSGGVLFYAMNEKWKRQCSLFRNELMYEKMDPETKKMLWFCIKFKETMYESPKMFRNDYAFNVDGSWLVFPTEYRTKAGKPKALFFRRKEKLVKELTYFCRFQRLIGVETQWELVYHMCSFLASVVKMPDGIFDPTPENISILNKVAERILITDCPEETLERLKDDRGFCIDPERLRTIDESTKRTMTNKAVRIANYLEIRKKYDDSKSKAQNAAICGVSDATIARFRRNRTELERICSSCFGIK